MNRENFEDGLTLRLRRSPFQPFVIELNEGDQWVVGQKEALFYYAGDSAMYFRPDGSFDFVDSENVKQFLDLAVVRPA
jgi:hypothetical protein